jgi:hypothetical protein
MNCEFCKKEFSNKSNLICHQKTAKYCLKLREENLPNGFNCDYCNEKFLRKSVLTSHLEKCKFKKELDQNELILKLKSEHKLNLESKLLEKDNIIKDLKKQIEDLQNKNQELALRAIDKPTNITNNKNTDVTNNQNKILNNIGVLNLDPDKLEEVFMNRMTLQHVIDGQLGVANLIHQHFLTDENNNPLAVCTDKSRQIIKYKGKNGEIIKDQKGYHLASKIYSLSEKAAMKVREGYIQNVYNNTEDDKALLKQEREPIIYVNPRCNFSLKRLLSKKMGLMMDSDRINCYPDNEEQEREFNYRFENLKSKYLSRPKKYKKREGVKDKAFLYNTRFDYTPEDPDNETDYEEIIEEEEEEFNFNDQEDYKLFCRVQDLKKEQNEERLKELKLIIEAKEWSQEKKDYYLEKINIGIEDIKLLKINVNKFGKALSIQLPSEN